MAIIHAIQKCHYYLAGVPKFEVWTDHRPLVGAFGKHLQNHHIADALSRSPVFGPCDMTFELEQLEHCLRIFDPSLTKMDEEYNETLELVKAGKNATHIQKSSKAYAYRRIIDLLCVCKVW